MYTVITHFFNLFSVLELLIKDIASTSISKSIILSFFWKKDHLFNKKSYTFTIAIS